MYFKHQRNLDIVDFYVKIKNVKTRWHVVHNLVAKTFLAFQFYFKIMISRRQFKIRIFYNCFFLIHFFFLNLYQNVIKLTYTSTIFLLLAMVGQLLFIKRIPPHIIYRQKLVIPSSMYIASPTPIFEHFIQFFLTLRRERSILILVIFNFQSC